MTKGCPMSHYDRWTRRDWTSCRTKYIHWTHSHDRRSTVTVELRDDPSKCSMTSRLGSSYKLIAFQRAIGKAERIWLDRAMVQNRIASPLIAITAPHASSVIDNLLRNTSITLTNSWSASWQLLNELSTTLSASKWIELWCRIGLLLL